MRFMGKKKKIPPRAAYRKKVSKLAPLKFRERNSLSETIGEGERSSTRENPTSAQIPTTPTNPAGAPRFGSSINANVTAPSPTVASSAPCQSSLLLISVLRLSGTFHSVSATTITAMGTLMKNAHRHEACCTNHPPRTGPIAAVIAVKPDHVPIARPRSVPGNEALITARLPGISSAAPIPCTARVNISQLIDGETPQPPDASANRTTPQTKTLRRPYKSPSEPPTSSSEASSSAYDSTTHCTSLTVACSAVCNAGSATFTTVPSMNARLDPKIVAAKIQPPFFICLTVQVSGGRGNNEFAVREPLVSFDPAHPIQNA